MDVSHTYNPCCMKMAGECPNNVSMSENMAIKLRGGWVDPNSENMRSAYMTYHKKNEKNRGEDGQPKDNARVP